MVIWKTENGSALDCDRGWSIALFEYCFQVPANRLGVQYFSLPQLKVLQVIMVVFAGFSALIWKSL